MKVRLTKATKILNKVRPVNTLLVVTDEKAAELFMTNSAEVYGGQLMQKKKRKMNLSQLNK
jgi:hypothetical protein